jgi:uncharacterized protein
MKLSLDHPSKGHQITHYEPGVIRIDQTNYQHSVCLMPNQIQPWKIKKVEHITENDIHNLLAFSPSLIIIGTGENNVTLNPQLLEICYSKNIGVEVSQTRAACWTYMTLLADVDHILAALIID